MCRGVFADIEETHQHEEKLRQESIALIEGDTELSRRLEMIQKAMALIFAYTIDYSSKSEDENTMQLLGIRLFNAGASGLKLALSGYYQTAFHQARDIMEIGYLLDYFRTSPEQRSLWKHADYKTRRKLFDPVKIRIALDERDNDQTLKRAEEYNKLSELASHATFRGFRLTTRGGFGELGPFVEKVTRHNPGTLGTYFPGAPDTIRTCDPCPRWTCLLGMSIGSQASSEARGA